MHSMSIQDPSLEFKDIVSPCVSMIPFYQYINPIQAALLNIYMGQAICEPCCRYHHGMVLMPQYRQPVIATTILPVVQDPLKHSCIPGLSLFCIFVNMRWTYEDGIVMSRSAARRFRYTANVSIYLGTSSNKIPSSETK